MKPTTEQQKIIDSQSNTIIVQSGAGTGKTSTMVEYVRNKIEFFNQDENSFCITAFTNSDVNNFKNKLNKLKIKTQPDCEEGVKINTMHSLVEQMINKIAKLKSIKIKKDNDSIDFFDDFVKVLNSNEEGIELLKKFHNLNKDKISEDDYFKEIINIYFFKNGLNKRKPMNVSDKQIDKFDNFIKKGLSIYFKHQKDNLILYTLDYSFDLFIYLINNFDFSKEERKIIFPYKYWLIDEIQDYSEQQFYTVFNIISNDKNINLLGVGDIAQCIYGWRNASIDYFNRFLKEIDKNRDITFYQLTKNFRTNENNLKIPNYLLKYNWSNLSQKTPIQLTSDKKYIFNTDDYEILNTLSDKAKKVAQETNVCYLPEKNTQQNPFEQICQIIKYLITQKNVNPNDICVLTKSNKEISTFATECVNKDIKFGRKGLFLNFSNSKRLIDIIKKIIAYFPISIRISIEKSDRKEINESIDVLNKNYETLIETIELFLCNPYIKATPQGEAFYNEKKEKINNIIKLMNEYVKLINQEIEYFQYNDKFRKNLSDLNAEIIELYSLSKKEDSVNVRTMTDCKGEEWDYVFILGDETSAEKKKTPNFELDFNLEEMDKRDVIDQQNKNYVILTRAKKVTFIQPNNYLLNKLHSNYSNKNKTFIKDFYLQKEDNAKNNYRISYDALALSGIFLYDKKIYIVSENEPINNDFYSWKPLLKINHSPLKSVTSISENSLYPLSGIISINQFKKIKSTFSDKNFFGKIPTDNQIENICLMFYKGDWLKFGQEIEKLTYDILESNDFNIKKSKYLLLNTIQKYDTLIKSNKNKYQSLNYSNKKALYKIVYYIIDLMCIQTDKGDKIKIYKNSKQMLMNFEKTSCIKHAEIDFMSENRLIELKCTKNYHDNHLLQILIYWRLGMHSENKDYFLKIKELEIIYPLINIAIIIEIDKIPNSLIEYLDKEILKY